MIEMIEMRSIDLTVSQRNIIIRIYSMKLKVKQVRYKWETLQIFIRKAWTDILFIYFEW